MNIHKLLLITGVSCVALNCGFAMKSHNISNKKNISNKPSGAFNFNPTSRNFDPTSRKDKTIQSNPVKLPNDSLIDFIWQVNFSFKANSDNEINDIVKAIRAIESFQDWCLFDMKNSSLKQFLMFIQDQKGKYIKLLDKLLPKRVVAGETECYLKCIRHMFSAELFNMMRQYITDGNLEHLKSQLKLNPQKERIDNLLKCLNKDIKLRDDLVLTKAIQNALNNFSKNNREEVQAAIEGVKRTILEEIKAYNSSDKNKNPHTKLGNDKKYMQDQININTDEVGGRSINKNFNTFQSNINNHNPFNFTSIPGFPPQNYGRLAIEMPNEQGLESYNNVMGGHIHDIDWSNVSSAIDGIYANLEQRDLIKDNSFDKKYEYNESYMLKEDTLCYDMYLLLKSVDVVIKMHNLIDEKDKQLSKKYTDCATLLGDIIGRLNFNCDMENKIYGDTSIDDLVLSLQSDIQWKAPEYLKKMFTERIAAMRSLLNDYKNNTAKFTSCYLTDNEKAILDNMFDKKKVKPLLDPSIIENNNIEESKPSPSQQNNFGKEDNYNNNYLNIDDDSSYETNNEKNIKQIDVNVNENISSAIDKIYEYLKGEGLIKKQETGVGYELNSGYKFEGGNVCYDVYLLLKSVDAAITMHDFLKKEDGNSVTNYISFVTLLSDTIKMLNNKCKENNVICNDEGIRALIASFSKDSESSQSETLKLLNQAIDELKVFHVDNKGKDSATSCSFSNNDKNDLDSIFSDLKVSIQTQDQEDIKETNNEITEVNQNITKNETGNKKENGKTEEEQEIKENEKTEEEQEIKENKKTEEKKEVKNKNDHEQNKPLNDGSNSINQNNNTDIDRNQNPKVDTNNHALPDVQENIMENNTKNLTNINGGGEQPNKTEITIPVAESNTTHDPLQNDLNENKVNENNKKIEEEKNN